MIEKQFDNLIVRVNRTNIEIHAERKDIEAVTYNSDLNDLRIFLKENTKKVWKNFQPKEADSWGSDYDEFYDKKTDNNGYLFFRNGLNFDSPSDETTLLYRFNKRKMESFIYDLDEYCEV